LKIGLNTNLYLGIPLDEVIRRIYTMGYEGIEVARTHLNERYEKFGEEYVNTVKNLARQYGITIYGVQGSWGPYTDENFTKSRIDTCRKLDCPLVNLGAGLPIGPRDDPEKVWEKTLMLLKELYDYAKLYGIEVAVEPEVRPYLSPEIPTINRYQYFERVAKEIPGIGLILDIEHAIVNNENPYFIIKKFGSKLKVVHVSDSIDGLHLHLIPGRGEIDFTMIFRALKEVGYSGFISVEIYPYYRNPDKAAYSSIIYIQKILAGI